MSWTSPRTWVTGELVTAALLNAHLRDNLLALYSRTVSFFVVPDISNAVSPGITVTGVVLPDGTDAFGEGHFYMPENYASGMTATPIVTPGASANLRWGVNAAMGAAGQAYNNRTNTTSLNTLAVTANVLNALTALSLSNVAAGDYVSLEFERDSSVAADTINTVVVLMGWKISYTAAG